MASQNMNEMQTSNPVSETMVKDRRGRRLELSCRMFFFGEDDFEGEATLLDLSTSGCKASSAIPSGGSHRAVGGRPVIWSGVHQYPARPAGTAPRFDHEVQSIAGC